MGRCRSCDRPIRWAITVNGDPIPLDAEPSERGTMRLEPTAPGAETRLALHVPDLDRGKYPGRLYLAHFATCPNASEHRKRRRRRPEPDPGPRYWGD